MNMRDCYNKLHFGPPKKKKKTNQKKIFQKIILNLASFDDASFK